MDDLLKIHKSTHWSYGDVVNFIINTCSDDDDDDADDCMYSMFVVIFENEHTIIYAFNLYYIGKAYLFYYFPSWVGSICTGTFNEV